MKKLLILSLCSLFLLIGCVSSKVPFYQADDEVVILAHGLGRSGLAMWRFEQRLENAGYEICTLDYATIGESVQSVLAETTEQIDLCISNAHKVHFIGHSLGGLVIRSYLQKSRSKIISNKLGKVILIGTPNGGSELADYYKDSWVMKVGGGISQALVTGTSSFGHLLDEIDINVGVIAGTKSSVLTKDLFNGPNDGLVSVESTKLENMRDFLTIDVSHSKMRYNEEVALQAIWFLRRGSFKH